jgi:shikimate dehydrogenase
MTAASDAGLNQSPVADGPAVYAVFGNPIKHSKSPAIHGAFAAQFVADISYRAVAVATDEFEEKVAAFFQRGGSGLNVTLPFKERAWAMADSVSERARKARAANCLIPLEGGGLHADNTDGLGMVRDMVINHGWQLAGRRTLVLGAGGAVRGILQPLLAERPASLTVVNRTPERAQQLAMEFADSPVTIHSGGLGSVAGYEFDLIINGTSAGLAGEMPDLPEGLLSERCCCYDLVYQSEPTAFMRWAAARAAWAVTDGLGMLVEQAAESFYLWRQRRPSTGPVIQQMRELMTQ